LVLARRQLRKARADDHVLATRHPPSCLER
jgi:hypothetical protein